MWECVKEGTTDHLCRRLGTQVARLLPDLWEICEQSTLEWNAYAYLMAKCNLQPSAGASPGTDVYAPGNVPSDEPPAQLGVRFPAPAAAELTPASAGDATHQRLLDALVAAADNSPPTSTGSGDTNGMVAEGEAELKAEPDGDDSDSEDDHTADSAAETESLREALVRSEALVAQLQAERDMLVAQLSAEIARRNESHASGGEYTTGADRPL